jgi:hypothetical protein
MSKSCEELSSEWEELKVAFGTLDTDVQKSLFSENVAAGSRARVAMRDVAKKLKLLARDHLALSKEVLAKKKEEKNKEEA